MLLRFLSAFVLSLLVSSSFLNTARAAERPNFVWLISEDSGARHFRLFADNGAPTPRIEALAEDGIAFTHAFSNAPVCSVARTTLITGCYAPRIGTQFHRRAVPVPLPDGLRMFPAYLRDAGYYTTNRDKKDYNAIEGEGVWDESSRRASWRNRADGQPFFHMQTFVSSHESSLHFDEDEIGKEPTETSPERVRIPPYHPDTPTFRYTYARYHDRIRGIDREIGAVIDELARDGLLEDTFIFFFGDHGGVLPRSKGYVYETGLHVPLVVRIPAHFRELAGISRKTRISGFVSFIDFGPTLLHLAGIAVPEGMDGRPFLGKGIEASEVNGRDETYGYADRFDEKYDLVRSLRNGRYKYIRSFQPFNPDALQNNYRYLMAAYREWRELWKEGKLDGVQRQFFEARAPEALYDLEEDPFETKNLAGDPAYRSTLADLRHRLTERLKAWPDLSFYPESVLVERAFADPTGFGAKHRDEISQLIDVADASLIPFDMARVTIDRALASENPWERYWALIAGSTHGSAARAIAARAREISEGDPELLVRVRAAEFLGLTGLGESRPVLLRALHETKDRWEALLVLNTVVLLTDFVPHRKLEISAASLSQEVRSAGEVKRRLEYLDVH